MNVVEGLKERLPEVEVSSEEGLGAGLFGLGLVIGGMRVVRGDRGGFSWLMPAVLIVGGLSLLIEGTLDRRSHRVDEAAEVVRRELAELDPFARAQVLKEVAQEQVEGLFDGV